MCGEVAFNVFFGVPEWNTVLLEKSVHVESRLETEEPPHLVLGQRACPVAFDSKRLQGLTRDIPPPVFESRRDVVRQIKSDAHRSILTGRPDQGDFPAFVAFLAVPGNPARICSSSVLG